MLQYIVRRILGMIPILIIISMIIFGFAKLAPGDPFSGDPDPRVRKAQVDKQREMWGLNDPLPKQYLSWAGKVAKGDFGVSIRHRKPVTDVMSDRISNTLLLGSFSLFITLIIGLPFGIAAGRRPYSIMDYSGTIVSNLGLATPNFFLGLLLIYFLSFKLGMFPSQGTVTTGTNYTGFRLLLDKLHHLFLPALTIGTGGAVTYFRYLRSEILEVSGKDFIRTARSKGVSNTTLMYKHTLRNAMIPIITLFGFELSGLVSGAIITEQIFSVPGIGRLFIESIGNRDYPIIMAVGMLSSVAILVGNLFADILYSVVDPRIRYD